MDLILKNGTLFLTDGSVKKGDIWVKDEKIYYIHAFQYEKTFVETFDASKYGIFPGLIYEQAMWKNLRQPKKYKQLFKQLISAGYTTFVDVIPWQEGFSILDWDAYFCSLHANSPIDFTFQMLIPAHVLTPQLVARAAKSHIRQIIISISNPIHLLKINWHSLSAIGKHYGTAFWIYPQVSRMSMHQYKKKIEEILNCWYYIEEQYGVKAGIRDSICPKTAPITPIHLAEDFVRKYSAIPARRAGLYPRKGSLSIGAYADLILVSLDDITHHRFIPKHVFIKGKHYETPIQNLKYGMGNRLLSHSLYM